MVKIERSGTESRVVHVARAVKLAWYDLCLRQRTLFVLCQCVNGIFVHIEFAEPHTLDQMSQKFKILVSHVIVRDCQ